jgi:hypothetical protein
MSRSSNSVMPKGVTVEPGRVNDFVDGIFGVNARNNKKALGNAVAISAAVVAYTAYKSRKLQRKP